MNISEILGSKLSDVYRNTSEFMCVYNMKNDTIMEVNPSMEKRSCEKHFQVEVVFSGDNGIKYIKMNGIPCMLTVLSRLGTPEEFNLMKMFPAHTKRWTQESNLVYLTDITSDGVWEWFPETGHEYMSERFWSILGYDQKDMDESPSSWMGLLNPNDKIMISKMYDDHLKSRGKSPYIAQARYTRSDGEEVIVLCRGSVVEWMPTGKPWRLLGTHTDITDIVKKDSVEAKTKFISRMSHEIRSPLCTILNECEILGDSLKTKVIRDTCKQLVSITDDILSIDTLKSNSLKLNCTCEDLSGALAMCVKRHRVEAKKKNIRLRTIIDEIPDAVIMDLGKFNQVIDNLVGNSLKYSDKGTILIGVEYEEDTCMCSIRVSDEGIGIDPSFHLDAFEELVQGDSTMIGVGIGLTLCRRLAQLMCGNVTIEKSAIGKGTTMLFTSYLPICEDEDSCRDVRMPSFGAKDSFRVLVVDDIKTNREILRRRLDAMKLMGLNITEIIDSEDGREAVNTFEEQHGDFHLVLMDCHMPILDGFDATVQIHDACSRMGIESVPVVAVTASVSTDIYDKCLSAGMKYVVTKPYSELDLMASIHSCLYNRQ